jgi:predicted RNA methylase
MTKLDNIISILRGENMPSFIGFVPTPYERMDGFFNLITVSPTDVVYDLGSGDGRLLFAALEKGAGRVVGVELDEELVYQAWKTAKDKGLDDRARFIEGDVVETDLSEATVVFCYLFPSASEALRPKFEEELRPGARVIIESFYIDEWKPAKTIDREGKSFFLYIMPPEKSDRVPS